MNKKYIPFIITSLLLCGCAKGPNVSEENALEVAVDDSDVDMSEVTSSDVKKSDGAYKIVFTTESGKYTYTVGTDGLVQDRKYEPGESEEQVIEEEKGEPVDNGPKVEDNTDEEKTRAEEAALANVGLSKDEVTSITSELNAEKTEYTVVITVGDSRTTCVVDADTGEVVSTSFN